jgi:filamentous hemagglutinin family protein
LFAGVSAVALLAYAMPANAVCLGRCSGGAGTSATTAAATAAITNAQQAAEATQQAMNSLSRATPAIQATLAMQNAAHNLALSSPPTTTAGLPAVTDGLSPGGLIVDPRVTAGTDPNLWVNANLPTQTTSNGVTTVTIQQTAQRAVMTWEQFNVGKNTVVDFDQSGGNSANGNSWIALNRIDAGGVPSQILGQIHAQGTVMLIDPNGIIFTGSSQINVHSLIAAAMDINSYGSPDVAVFNSSGKYVPVTVGGVAQTAPGGAALLAPPGEDNGNAAFLSSGLYVNGASSNAGGSLILSIGSIANQTNQGIVVQRGASIATDISGFDNGGMVALLGPSVINHGSIVTGSGQIVLGAAPISGLPSRQAAALRPPSSSPPSLIKGCTGRRRFTQHPRFPAGRWQPTPPTGSWFRPMATSRCSVIW